MISATQRRQEIDVEDDTVWASGDTAREELGDTALEERAGRQARERQPPMWLGDYFSGEDLQEEEDHVMAFAVSTDPWLYEEAIKDSIWLKAMNREMELIEKTAHGHSRLCLWEQKKLG